MKRVDSRSLWGLLLIVGGLFLLLANLNIFNIWGIFDAVPLLWAVALGLVGIGFLSTFAVSPDNWWAAIPGATLVSVAILIVMDLIMPRVSNFIGGSIVTGGIGISFLLVYIRKRENWWALIPGGVMFTIAMMIFLEPLIDDDLVASFFFFGLAATFGLLYILPTSGTESQKWAIYPALGTLGMSVFLLIVTTSIMQFIIPLAIVGAGVYLLIRGTQQHAGNIEEYHPEEL